MDLGLHAEQAHGVGDRDREAVARVYAAARPEVVFHHAAQADVLRAQLSDAPVSVRSRAGHGQVRHGVGVGDRVKVLGRVEKREDERNWVALKVEIDRRTSTTKPSASAGSM